MKRVTKDMIKRYFFISVLCSMSAVQKVSAREGEQELREAISVSSVEEVQKLLKRDGLLTKDNKKEYIDQAQEQLTKLKESTTLLNPLAMSNSLPLACIQDVIYLYGGAGLLLGSVTLFKKGYFAKAYTDYINDPNSLVGPTPQEIALAKELATKGSAFIALGVVSTAVALYVGKKGFFGETRTQHLKNAEVILQLLKKAS